MALIDDLLDRLCQRVVSIASKTGIGRRVLGNNIWWNASSVTLRTALLATRGSSSFGQAMRISRELVEDITPWLPRDAIAMEFGSGVGLNTLVLSSYCRKVVGVDMSKQLVRIANKLAKDTWNVTFTCYDGRRIPFSEETFDFVFSVGVFERIDKEMVQEYLHEIARVLRLDGVTYLYFLSHRALNTDFIRRLGRESYFYFSDEEAASAVRGAGMNVITVIDKPVAVIVLARKSPVRIGVPSN